jgi:hypothetical protein
MIVGLANMKAGTAGKNLACRPKGRNALEEMMRDGQAGPEGSKDLAVYRGANRTSEAAYDYGTSTTIVGHVDDVRMLELSPKNAMPLIWNGSRASARCPGCTA